MSRRHAGNRSESSLRRHLSRAETLDEHVTKGELRRDRAASLRNCNVQQVFQPCHSDFILAAMDRDRSHAPSFCDESAGGASGYFKPKGGGLSAMWHVRIQDRNRLIDELAALDRRLLELDIAIRQ